jgi:L-iditol 2-dehydrogenase
MLAVQLVAHRTLEPNLIPDPPDPGPGEILVRLHGVGICGSDLHWYQDGGVGDNRARYPMILGHEPVGEVVATGPGVTSHSVGSRVSIEPSITCGHCEHCLAGRHNNCLHSIFMGGPDHPGFYRELAVVPARNADVVPGEFSLAQASLIEPVAVLVHVMELIHIRVGDTAAVLGAGPIGILSAIMARRAGASRVFITDKLPHRLELARKLAGAEAILVPRQSARDAVMDLTGGRGVDLTLDAAGYPETIQTGIEITRPSGQFVLIGIPSQRIFNVDIHTAMAKELRIQTIKRSNHRGQQAITLIRSGIIPESLITHRMPLERTPDAFELVSNYRGGVGKMLVDCFQNSA